MAEAPGGSRGQEDTKSKNLDLGGRGCDGPRSRLSKRAVARPCRLKVAESGTGKVWESLINDGLGFNFQNQMIAGANQNLVPSLKSSLLQFGYLAKVGQNMSETMS